MTFPAPDFPPPAHGHGVQVTSLFYEGPTFRGEPTRVFAWIARPVSPAAASSLPAVVLAHGGSGTADAGWALQWARRGFVAIAMDLCGSIPLRAPSASPDPVWRRHPHGGPPGWGGFDQLDWPEEDQWMFHGVGNLLLARALMKSLPEVDSASVGLVGVSWGGVLASIAGALDADWCFVVPIYGCGFLPDTDSFYRMKAGGDPEKMERWASLWEPSRFLPGAQARFFWINGTDDAAFSLQAWARSVRATPGAWEHLRVRFPHGQWQAERLPEVVAFVQACVRSTRQAAPDPSGAVRPSKLPARFSRLNERDGVFLSQSSERVRWVRLVYTVGTGPARHWRSVPAATDEAGTVSAPVPANAQVAYFAGVGPGGCRTSSPAWFAPAFPEAGASN